MIATVLSVVFGSLAAKNGRYKGMTVFWSLSSIVGGVLYWAMTGSATPLMGLVLVVLASLFYGMVNGVQQIVPYTYPMKVLKPDELAGGMAFMGGRRRAGQHDRQRHLRRSAGRRSHHGLPCSGCRFSAPWSC